MHVLSLMPSPVDAERRPPALFSIHDVMPETLSRVAAALGRLRAQGAGVVTLLVVPGKTWSAADVDQLRRWSDDDCRLAGHGWVHRRGPIRNWGHRLHSLLLSRNAAEHLSRGRDDLLELVQRCGAWFAEQKLSAPELYVPPAWALGALSPGDLASTPFRFVETLTGVFDVEAARMHRLPLVGFEADTFARAAGLRPFNAVSALAARSVGAPLRIGLHPDDYELRLAASIDRLARGPWRSLAYGDLAAPDSNPANSRR